MLTEYFGTLNVLHALSGRQEEEDGICECFVQQESFAVRMHREVSADADLSEVPILFVGCKSVAKSCRLYFCNTYGTTPMVFSIVFQVYFDEVFGIYGQLVAS
jgi:hypothetical protein